MENSYSYFTTKTYAVFTQKNRVDEMVVFEHPKQMFKSMV